MDDLRLSDAEKRNLEAKAIDSLLDNGINFSVPLKLKYKDTPMWVKWCNSCGIKIKWRDRRVPEDWDVRLVENGNGISYVRNIRINPLCLGTIISSCKVYLGIDFDENKLRENPLRESKRLFQYADKMAEIVALASLNGDGTKKELDEYKNFFIAHLTPRLLLDMVVIINQVCDPTAFITSIRLTTGFVNGGATSPKADLIE